MWLLHTRHGDERDRACRTQQNLSERDIREGLEGNICRCTGYHNIVKSVQAAAEKMGDKMPEGIVNDGIGASVRRKEDKKFGQSASRYTDDINRPNQLHVYFAFRSSFCKYSFH